MEDEVDHEADLAIAEDVVRRVDGEHQEVEEGEGEVEDRAPEADRKLSS